MENAWPEPHSASHHALRTCPGGFGFSPPCIDTWPARIRNHAAMNDERSYMVKWYMGVLGSPGVDNLQVSHE